jgi:dolichol-phosphate mannosyltransferase
MLFTAITVLLVAQTVALIILLARMAPGRHRRPPVAPVARNPMAPATSVSVIVATLNEAHRIGPCLAGLRAQSALMREVLVVDSNSTDGTRDLVHATAAVDHRFRVLPDDDPPADWIGKVWALELGLREATGEWVLGIDADTAPEPWLVDAVVSAAEQDALDVVSFSPQFTGQSAAERFVQPAMLTTLVYRCGAVGAGPPPPDRVLANGQCFLAKRAVLLAHGGYAPARTSFSDDVTLARYLAHRGVRVGFLDGSRVYRVRSYASVREMWREWGRSFDLKDATPALRRWMDVYLVWLVQALPLPLLLVLLWSRITSAPFEFPPGTFAPDIFASGTFASGMAGNFAHALWLALVSVNGVALAVRVALLPAMRGSYAERGVPYWCSFLADVPAAVRLTWSTWRAPHTWRGRKY